MYDRSENLDRYDPRGHALLGTASSSSDGHGFTNDLLRLLPPHKRMERSPRPRYSRSISWSQGFELGHQYNMLARIRGYDVQ